MEFLLWAFVGVIPVGVVAIVTLTVSMACRSVLSWALAGRRLGDRIAEAYRL